ncbi:MAG: hypothetical protein AAF716_20130 [Cyanobacteria bacterium P01_D01_bin.1]
MKYWEFLIQKEGDDTWLPLETHQVEILAGRYRVVAHTDRTNTSIDIQVSQLVTTEAPPRKRVRNHTSRTSSAGLAVVIPYVHLKPGQWELTCSSQEVAADLDSWEYTVQLQVFDATEEDLSSTWLTPSDIKTDGLDGASQFESSVPTNPDLPLTRAQEHSQELLREGLRGSSRSDLEVEGQSAEKESPAYGIALKRQAFFAQSDQPMTIAGQVQALSSVSRQDESQLWLRLQNPEDGQVIMEAHRPINLDRLPADFKVKIQLPAHVTTQIVWGEVSLRSVADAEHPSIVLSSTVFTITAGISQLLDDVANSTHFDSEFSDFDNELSASSEQDSAVYSNGTSSEDVLLPLAVPSLNGSTSVPPAVGVVVPPQTNRQDNQVAETSSRSRIELPSFPAADPLIVSDPPTMRSHTEPERSHTEPEPDFHEASAVQLPPMVTKPAQFMGTSIEDDDLETAEIAALLENINDDLEPAVPANDSFGSSRASSFLSTTPELSDDLLSDQPTDEAEPTSAELDNPHHRQVQRQENAKAAFRSLNLRDHFMQRLFDLTHDEVSQANKFAEDLQAAGVSSEGPQAFTQTDALANSEVVIFEEAPVVEVDSQTLPPDPASAVPKALPASSVPGPSVPVSSTPIPSTPSPSAPVPSVPPSPTTRLPRRRQSYSNNQNITQDQSQIQSLNQPPAQSQSSDLPSQPLFPRSRVDLPTASVSEADRNRQLRLARLRQRQAEARAARAGEPPAIESSANELPTTGYSEPSQSLAEPPVRPATSFPTNALTLYRDAGRDAGHDVGRDAGRDIGQSAEELPEVVLPIISVPMGDLIAGDRVTITVRTRPSVFKPFIKLWMIDRQSRTVVGEPKLLTDLKPDALGDLQTSTELLVPMGCLDVQFAAIAIDIATQQESNKAIVNRHVIPAMQALPPTRGVRERDW